MSYLITYTVLAIHIKLLCTLTQINIENFRLLGATFKIPYYEIHQYIFLFLGAKLQKLGKLSKPLQFYKTYTSSLQHMRPVESYLIITTVSIANVLINGLKLE